jgi:ribonucleoside-diphosphate reductase alpha chain
MENISDITGDFLTTITTKYEDVKKQTTEEYFNNNEFSIDAFKKKYTIDENETYVKALKRVCDYIASVESTQELRDFWSDRWFDEIYNDWWHPAGSIMQGAGTNRKISLANCTTISLGALRDNEEWDSLEAIVRNTAYTVAKCAAYRQGLGVDFSCLRPAGTKVLNSANQSTGAVHWMEFIDKIGYSVGQKGRIPAMLFSLKIDHPDIEQFITVKSDYTRIQNANISVQIVDKFYTAVENDSDWELKFEVPGIKKGDKVYIDVHSIDMDVIREKETGKYYKIATHDKKKEIFTKVVKAKKLMELIAKNMYQNAEPGIQNIDIARKYSNSDYMYDPSDEYDSRILSTNACSEQYLSRESMCFLASANVGRFSNSSELYIKQLERVGISMNRFLDNVNECELVYKTYATPHQRLSIQKLRRTGAGITNIVGWLIKKKLSYASKEANNEVEEFIKIFNHFLYYSSECTGKEKGNFGLFNKDKWKTSPFVQRVIEESKKLHEKYGIPVITGNSARNVTNSSIAPTGTLSLMFRDMVMSYGIEAAFFLFYWKRTRISGGYQYYFVVPKVIRDIYSDAGFPLPMTSDTIKDDWAGTKGKEVLEFILLHLKDVSTINFKSSAEIDPMDKLEFMSQIMKWVDSSISTTYLLPLGSDWKSVYKFIMASHEKEVKSIAAFPDKKMYGIVSEIPFKTLAFKLKSEGVDMHNQNFDDNELKELNLSRQKISHTCHDAPSRLQTLEADINVVSVKGEKFCIVIGLQNGSPYEIFGGHLNGLGLKSNYKKGKITKINGKQYALEFDDIVIEDFSKQFTPTEQIMFRLASTSLRHGVPIHFIVDQLQKASEDITSMGAAAARVLKKYIKDGEVAKGKSCPSCGNGLVYLEGCVSCSTCGWSKCS